MASKSRILKNTLILYARKIISIVLGLIGTRLLLEYLGVDDFGLYGLLGSVVAIFSSIRSFFASSVQRFINIERSNNIDKDENIQKVNKVFSTGVLVHIAIGLIFFLIVNIGGLIMLKFLNIGLNNIYTALIILECAILASSISIFTVPFDALIISYERFNAYALFAIIDSVLKFLAVLILAVSSHRVVLYSILMLAASIIALGMSYTYCKHKFPAICLYNKPNDKKLLRQMTGFAGWQFFGSTGYTVSNQGINFVLNHFGGVALNAARGIAYQLMNTVQQFVADISLSFQPQSMMSYNRNNKEFYSLFNFNSKLSFAICFAIVFPVCLFSESILKIWLTETPQHTINFVRAIMLYVLIRSLHGAIDILFKSAGKMKYYQLTEFLIMVASIPTAYFILQTGAQYYWAFLNMCVFEILNFLSITFLAHFQLSFDLKRYLSNIILPISAMTVIGVILFCYKDYFPIFSDSIPSLIVNLVIAELIALSLIYIILLSRKEQQELNKIIKNKIRHLNL